MGQKCWRRKIQLRPLSHRPFYIIGTTEYWTSNHLGVTRKILWWFGLATFTSEVWYANHSPTKTWYSNDITNRNRIASESNQQFYKCSWQLLGWIFSIVLYSWKHIIYCSTVTYSSVVAEWHADQKDAGSILLSFFLLLFYFKSEGHCFKSSEQ